MHLVKVSYPLKQGLKLYGWPALVISFIVKVSYPLKQGLKHEIIIGSLGLPLG